MYVPKVTVLSKLLSSIFYCAHFEGNGMVNEIFDYRSKINWLYSKTRFSSFCEENAVQSIDFIMTLT